MILHAIVIYDTKEKQKILCKNSTKEIIKYYVNNSIMYLTDEMLQSLITKRKRSNYFKKE